LTLLEKLGTILLLAFQFTINLHIPIGIYILNRISLCHKISVIDSLVRRALTVCDQDLIDRELQHTKKALVRNQCPTSLINSRIKVKKLRTATSQPSKDDNDCTKRINLPYTRRVTSEMANTIRRLNDFDVAFKPTNKIPTMLIKRQENLDLTKKLPCNNCPSMYIGETGRSLPIRMSEHMRDARNERETVTICLIVRWRTAIGID